MLCHFHIGETANTLHKCTLIPGGSELIVYTTLSGGIGMLVPFASREVCPPPPPLTLSSHLSLPQDIDFFQHLEMHLRAEWPNLVGRDHLSFRSYYVPVKVCSHPPSLLFLLPSPPPPFQSFLSSLTTHVCDYTLVLLLSECH